MHKNSNTIQSKVVVIRRKPNQGFGFTLRHFIAYPPEDEESWPETSESYQRKAMETIFIKEVQPNGPASYAGLQTGDRVLMVNNVLIAGISYSTIVSMIKQTPTVLLLHVVPKECDILQMSYDIAHTPESNRLSKVSANIPSISAQNPLHHRMISYPADSMRTIQKRDNDEYNHVGPGTLVIRNDNGLLRTKPSNLTVLNRPNVDYDFMVRLRKSIEQKEEFLKSPVPHPQTTFFQQSMPARGQVSTTLMKPPAKDLLPASCDMNNFYAKNLPIAFPTIGTFNSNRKSSIEITQATPMSTRNHHNYANSSSLSASSGSSNSSSNSIKDKFHKELEFLETLPELGVTNQVFERKLVSHLTKGFDPFKQLSINTTSDVGKSSVQAKARLDLHKTKSAGSTIDEYQLPVESSSQTEESINEDKSSVGKSESNDEAKSMQSSTEVVRRYKPIVIDDNKPMRRISYLRATNSENEYHLETTTDPTNNENKNKRTSIQQELKDSASIEEIVEINGKIEIKDEIKAETDSFETEMEVKSSCIYGKRMSDYRSWRQVKIVLKGDILKIYPPGRSSKSDINVIELDVRNFNILDESVDKKKYVFRLQSKPRIITNTLLNDEFSLNAQLATMNNDITNNENDYTEIVFKTKSITEMKKLFGILQEKCNLCSVYNTSDNNLHGKQLAEPQKTAAIASVPTSSYSDDNAQDYSPQSSTSRGEIETESISPVMKTRKSHYKNVPEKDLGSPKTKNWKDLLFRRHHGNNADISPWNLASTSKTIGSIGVPLRSCPMSKENEFVPNIVEVCTNIVETKGLTVVGIYRIPGNKAAISELKEQVNKSDFCWDRVNTDVRWEDVNVVSSLLKLFIRSLPDALLPSSFYINFIEADKKTGDRRLKELKHLLHSLPQISYETMKHILRHLSRVSKNCNINLMEPKNLAIIFGPSIIRTPNDTLEIAVKDMKHQCRIVELLLTQYEYFFEDGELPELDSNSAPFTSSTCTSHQDQTSLLLDNVSKIEQRLQDRDESKTLTSRLIPHLRRRTHSKRRVVSSDTYSGESVLSLDYKKSPEAPIKDNQKINKEISILLTDDESSNSRISDSGSMSLTTITDTLDTKLRNLRSGSESNDENGSPNKQSIANRRNTFQQPLILHENIPYADESPERSMLPDNSTLNHLKNFPSRNSAFVRDISRNSRFSSVYESCSDDSEVSTTSDPKESSIITPLVLELYKKRRDYRLFRSASFNCRNYSSRVGGNGYHNTSSLTKDEKTDMNLTKKRQIQNKQNRSIKRRHTVGGPHDYSTTVTRRPTRTSKTNGNSNDHVLEVGICIKNVNRRN